MKNVCANQRSLFMRNLSSFPTIVLEWRASLLSSNHTVDCPRRTSQYVSCTIRDLLCISTAPSILPRTTHRPSNYDPPPSIGLGALMSPHSRICEFHSSSPCALLAARSSSNDVSCLRQ
ncbi:hypothetical protein Scep_025903 [Stephania cephalantha]|uniref:Uncharacterized protein n=1 Tax=Stephania cephalantha TaxID=152367 RepID=A0AAP0ET01_9MAGN